MSWLQCPTPCPRLEVELKKQKKRIEEESNYTFHPKINTRRSPKKDLVDRENLPIADRLYVDAMKRLIENKIREQMDIKPGDEELTFTPSFATSLSSRCVSRACSNDSSDVHTDAEISSWSSNSVSRSRSFSLSRSASMDDFEARTPPLAEVKKKSPSPRDNKVSLARMEKATRRRVAGRLPLASVPGKLNFRTYSNDPQCPSEIRSIALASQESVDMGLSVDCDRGRLTFNYQPQIRTQSTPVVERNIDNDDVNGDITTLTFLTISEPEAEAASFTSTETALFGSVELDDASPDEIVTEVIVEKVEVRLRLESEDIEVQAVTEKDLDAEVEIEAEMNGIEKESQTVFSAAVGEVSTATETSNALGDSVAKRFVGESTGTVDSGVVVTGAVGAAVAMSVKSDMPMVGVSEADADAALKQQGAPKKIYTLERSLRRSLSGTEVHAKANPSEGLRLHICSTSVNEHTPVTSTGSTPTYIQSHRGEMYHQPPYSHDTSHC